MTAVATVRIRTSKIVTVLGRLAACEAELAGDKRTHSYVTIASRGAGC